MLLHLRKKISFSFSLHVYNDYRRFAYIGLAGECNFGQPISREILRRSGGNQKFNIVKVHNFTSLLDHAVTGNVLHILVNLGNDRGNDLVYLV